jgi:pyruvate,water dikinase
VLFTRTPRVVEASPGLGALLVNGQVTPDAWTLDDTGIIARRLGSAGERLDRDGEELLTTALPTDSPAAPFGLPTPPPDALRETVTMCLADDAVLELDRLGRAISETLGYEADIEWALANERFRILQARPITASVSLPHAESHGIPASPGRASGTTCVLRGPHDFHRFQPGAIIETGGLLSHAAIVARELRIPAILSVPDATTRFPSGTRITIDGTTGRIE